jgi:hypothetical protein
MKLGFCPDVAFLCPSRERSKDIVRWSTKSMVGLDKDGLSVIEFERPLIMTDHSPSLCVHTIVMLHDD